MVIIGCQRHQGIGRKLPNWMQEYMARETANWESIEVHMVRTGLSAGLNSGQSDLQPPPSRSAVMRHANDDKIVIKRDQDGHWVYFSVPSPDGSDSGTILISSKAVWPVARRRPERVASILGVAGIGLTHLPSHAPRHPPATAFEMPTLHARNQRRRQMRSTLVPEKNRPPPRVRGDCHPQEFIAAAAWKGLRKKPKLL